MKHEYYDVMRYADGVTGFIGAALLFGVFVGFIRAALGADGERLRLLSVGICLFSVLALIECLRVRPITTWSPEYAIYGRMLGVAFNLACGYAAYVCLRFLWLAIPETINGRPERAQWSWYTAPLYPPWGIPGDWRAFVDSTIELMSRRNK